MTFHQSGVHTSVEIFLKMGPTQDIHSCRGKLNEVNHTNDDDGDGDDDDDDDGDDDGYPAYSHHDKIPPWWGNVSNDEGGNMSVSKTHHTPCGINF